MSDTTLKVSPIFTYIESNPNIDITINILFEEIGYLYGSSSAIVREVNQLVLAGRLTRANRVYKMNPYYRSEAVNNVEKSINVSVNDDEFVPDTIIIDDTITVAEQPQQIMPIKSVYTDSVAPHPTPCANTPFRRSFQNAPVLLLMYFYTSEEQSGDSELGLTVKRVADLLNKPDSVVRPILMRGVAAGMLAYDSVHKEYIWSGNFSYPFQNVLLSDMMYSKSKQHTVHNSKVVKQDPIVTALLLTLFANKERSFIYSTLSSITGMSIDDISAVLIKLERDHYVIRLDGHNIVQWNAKILNYPFSRTVEDDAKWFKTYKGAIQTQHVQESKVVPTTNNVVVAPAMFASCTAGETLSALNDLIEKKRSALISLKQKVESSQRDLDALTHLRLLASTVHIVPAGTSP